MVDHTLWMDARKWSRNSKFKGRSSLCTRLFKGKFKFCLVKVRIGESEQSNGRGILLEYIASLHVFNVCTLPQRVGSSWNHFLKLIISSYLVANIRWWAQHWPLALHNYVPLVDIFISWYFYEGIGYESGETGYETRYFKNDHHGSRRYFNDHSLS